MFSIQLHRLLTLAENKYNQLLTILIIFFLGFPFVYFSKVVAFILFLLTVGGLLLINYQIRLAKQKFKLYLFIVALSIPVEIVVRFYSPQLESIAVHIIQTLLSLFLLAASVYAILQETTTTQTVTTDTIRGGICVYLLLGMIWIELYQLIYYFNPDAFQGLSATNSSGDLLYFSFVTLTTVGYGDISPVSAVARTCANLEAITGVVFLATFIARLVSLYNHDQG